MTEIPECFYRVSVKALILNETRDKFLICKESIGYWDIPGGGLEWGETHKEGLSREIAEEMDLKVQSIADHPSYFITGVMTTNPDVKIANIIYETVVENLEFTPSSECQEVRFVDRTDMADLKVFDGAAKLGDVFKLES